jgi:hypothetical protein
LPSLFAGGCFADADLGKPLPLLVSGVAPAQGPTTGAIQLEVRGSQFRPGASVTIDGIAATDARVVSPTSILLTLPAHSGAFGKVDVTVQNPDGTSGGGPLFSYFLGSIKLSKPIATAVPMSLYPAAVLGGDLDGDNNLDLIVLTQDAVPPPMTMPQPNSGISVLLGNGKGGFTAAPGFASYSLGIVAAVNGDLGDLNGDGKLDLVVSNTKTDSISVFLGKGDGTLQTPPKTVSLGASAGPAGVALADYNGDGKLDCAVANTTASTISVLYGNGKGGFTTGPAPKVSGPLVLAAQDMNGDGKPDLVATGTATSGFAQVLLNDGSGNLQPQVLSPADNTPIGVVAADFDGDGKPDVAVTNVFSQPTPKLTLYKGDGSGGLQSFPALTASLEPYGIKAADFNLDGQLDLAVGHFASNDLDVYLGMGNLQFQSPTSAQLALLGAGWRSTSVVVADIDHDGKMDVISNLYTDKTIVVLFNSSQ